jgi:hypothetical protein
MNSVTEYAAPKESNSAHMIIFSNPIEASMSPLDKVKIQNAKKKIAGVSSSEYLMLFLIDRKISGDSIADNLKLVFIMGNSLKMLDS